MELTSAMVAADHAIFDWQRTLTIRIFSPTDETWGTAFTVTGLRRQSSRRQLSGTASIEVPGDETTFSILKSAWGATLPRENDQIVDSYDAPSVVWRVKPGGVEDCTLGTRWKLTCQRVSDYKPAAP